MLTLARVALALAMTLGAILGGILALIGHGGMSALIVLFLGLGSAALTMPDL